MTFFRDMSVNPLLLTGVYAGLLASVACGLVGPYVITRRIVFLVGAIAHVAVGGLGLAVFLPHIFPDAFGWMQPIHGAAMAALLGAVLIGLVHERVRERMDTLIGALWAVGMAGGLLLIKLTPGYITDQQLMTFLFGNISAVAPEDIRLILVLDLLIIAVVAIFHKRLLAICVDEQQAALQGVSVLWTNLLLLCLVALTVIALIKVVGLILVLAMLTLPAATVGRGVRRMGPLMLLTVLLCMALTLLPRVAAYELETRWPAIRVSPEAAIVLTAAAVYLVVVAASSLRRAVL